MEIEEFERLLEEPEGENLEFKAARSSFSANKVAEYICALSNEGGGKLVLGVSDTQPREVLGSEAFPDLNEIKNQLFAEFRFRVEVESFMYSGRRVLILKAPPRPRGMVITYKNQGFIRIGQSLRPMSMSEIETIHQEKVLDYSALTLNETSLDDLAPEAILVLRNSWERRRGSASTQPDLQLLEDLELIVNERCTVAALILLGTRKAVRRHLPQAEVIFEFRQSHSKIESEYRTEFQDGFFLWQDKLWDLIDRWNLEASYQDGFFKWTIKAFKEKVIREAILNAVCHRDYQKGDSVFLKMTPAALEIESPGGFPPGVTVDNILDARSWRNKRIAETLQRCGLVERSGQGADMMFRECIIEAKSIPDYSQSDRYRVLLQLKGEIEDQNFLLAMSKLTDGLTQSLDIQDLLILHHIRRTGVIPMSLKNRESHIKRLQDLDLIERIGRRYILSKNTFAYLGERAEYTRQKGLDSIRAKVLLEQHIENFKKEGCRMSDLKRVLPDRNQRQVRTLLVKLRAEGKVEFRGGKKFGRWFPKMEMS